MAKETRIRQLTTSIFDFPALARSEEAKYVDKTDLLYEVARNKDDAQLFISRPRRFGKSLMLSTLKAMFEGRRDLFTGLKIHDMDWEGWNTPHPVYSFSMSRANGETFAKFEAALGKLVRDLCLSIGLDYDPAVDATVNFECFLAAAAAKSPTGKIVVLIDEYDEPVAKFLNDLETLERVRNVLHDFFEKLKTNSGTIRFLMMTGVTKLTKLSVFSGANHLTDLSLSPRFATLLGYTPEELDGVLRENVEEFGERNGWDFATAKAKILEWYDGYRFSPQSEARVVNPVSLGRLFSPDGGTLKSYWETTGGATLVFNRLKAAGMFPADLENVRVRPIQLDVCSADTLPVESLLYQSGYLTIKEVIPSPSPEDRGVAATDTYRLAPPNLEVRQSLRDGYISQVMHLDESKFDTLLDRAKRQIAAGDLTHFLYESLFGLYAAIPPDWIIGNEAEAKRYFLLFASMVGANPQPEVPSLLGYADAVIETKDNVFVFEFKFKRSSKAALKQIRDRGYADKWRGGPRPVTLIGVNFNPVKLNIDIPVIESL